MVLYTLALSLSFLTASFVYQRNVQMQPEQLVVLRSFFGTLICIVTVNKDLWHVMYASVPHGQGKNIALRCLQGSLINLIEMTIIKYISLIFQGIARNLSPIATIIMSFYTTGEHIKKTDLLYISISLIGVTCTTIGFSLNNHAKCGAFEDTSPSPQPSASPASTPVLLATLSAALLVPILSAWGNITTSRMRGLDRRTVSCFQSPSTGLLMFTLIIIKGEIAPTMQLLCSLELLDWCLLLICGGGVVVVQILRYVAFQCDEPGKLSQYIYLSTLYQLLFDVFIFQREFIALQWIGFSIIFISYSLKFWSMFQELKQ